MVSARLPKLRREANYMITSSHSLLIQAQMHRYEILLVTDDFSLLYVVVIWDSGNQNRDYLLRTWLSSITWYLKKCRIHQG